MSDIIAKKADRDSTKNQIEVVVDEVIVRNKPAKNGKNLGTIDKGIYDYLDIKVGADGEWIQLEEDEWVFRSDNNIKIFVATATSEEPEVAKSEDINEAKPEETVTETSADVASDTGVASASTEFESEPEVVVTEEPEQEAPVTKESDSNEETEPVFKEDNKKYSLYKVGDAVKVKTSAERYVGGPAIPDKFKGVKLYVTALANGSNIVSLSTDKAGIYRVGRVHARDLEKF